MHAIACLFVAGFALQAAWGGASQPPAPARPDAIAVDSPAIDANSRQVASSQEVAPALAAPAIAAPAVVAAPTEVANATASKQADARPSLNLETPSFESRDRAPLMLFSLGSVAVGGLFYAISQSLDGKHVVSVSDGRSQFGTAIGIAGVTALIAAGSYFYFSRHQEGGPDWSAGAAVAPDPAGGVAVSAVVTLPLPSSSR